MEPGTWPNREFAGWPNLSLPEARTPLHRGPDTRGSRLPLGVIWPLRSEQRSEQHAPTSGRRMTQHATGTGIERVYCLGELKEVARGEKKFLGERGGCHSSLNHETAIFYIRLPLISWTSSSELR